MGLLFVFFLRRRWFGGAMVVRGAAAIATFLLELQSLRFRLGEFGDAPQSRHCGLTGLSGQNLSLEILAEVQLTHRDRGERADAGPHAEFRQTPQGHSAELTTTAAEAGT
jgi:hypothetical protein